MPRTVTTVSGFTTRSLGFGTARLHRVGLSLRQRILDAAIDAGLTHLDTAPAYGEGLAERAVGAAVRSRRDRVVIAGKYGLTPDPLADGGPLPWQAARLVRVALRRAPAAVAPPLTAAGLRASLDASLRRLQTDYLDLLLLHEPAPERVPDLPALLGALDAERQSGRIRAFGIAGAWPGVAALARIAGRHDLVIQTAESDWSPPVVPDITFGVISQGPQSRQQAAVDPAAALARLRAARARRPDGVLLVTTTRPDRIGELAEAGV